MEVFEAILKRRSVRDFEKGEIPKEKIEKLKFAGKKVLFCF
jgi:nitroreductase